MFVCGGLTSCWIVCCGVTIVLAKLRMLAGRHFAAAESLKAKPPRPLRRHRRRAAATAADLGRLRPGRAQA